MKKLGVAIVHGMGAQPSDFADGLIEELSARLEAAQLDPREIHFEPVWWAPVVQPREDATWRAMKSGGELSYQSLRRFVLGSLGDAIAYQPTPGAANNTYGNIHGVVRDSLTAMRTALGHTDAPLIVIAHSLGGAIMSNYIWDRQHGRNQDGFGATPFERMDTLAGLITFGCNIPMFTLAYQKVESIRFPPASLHETCPALVPYAKWLNFYDRDDILGWPLRPLGDFNDDPESFNRYDRVVSEDIEVTVGGPLTSWNPLSHSEYWTNDSFTRPTATLVGDILRAL